jgi:uncharacterized protein YjbJ (UPF0337 family)
MACRTLALGGGMWLARGSGVSRNGVASGLRRGRLRLPEIQTMADDLTKDGLKNQGEGLGDQVKGRARNVVGGLTGDSSEQIKGKAEELKGKAQRKIGEKQVDIDNDV